MQELCALVRGITTAWIPKLGWSDAAASACQLRIICYCSRRQAGYSDSSMAANVCVFWLAESLGSEWSG